MKDPYAVLGLDSSADPELLEAKYNELHDLYGEQRFKSGEEGNEGARKLQELEEAWVVISANIERDKKKAAFGGDYSRIDDLIRAGKYNEAQDMLDAISDRNGEWHYMQAIVFYKREWLTEAKAQLEMALREEPNNHKYRASHEKLILAMSGNTASAQNARQNNAGQNAPYGGGQDYEPQPGGNMNDMSNCLSTCCCAYCLTDCLCNAMRCC